MSGKSKWDYLKAIHGRYRKASKPLRSRILDEFCQVCGYNRKYAIRLLSGPAPQRNNIPSRGRRPTYAAKVIGALTAIWQAAGYPCSARLKALLPLWLPWAIKQLTLSAQAQSQLLKISPATIDRRLAAKKRQLKTRLYGRTKPGTLSSTISPSKPTPGTFRAQALPRSIWYPTREIQLRANSFTHSMSPIFTPLGWKPGRSSARARSAYLMP